MKKKLIRPSAKEDAAITKAAKSDPDSRPPSQISSGLRLNQL